MRKVGGYLAFSRKWVGNHFYMAKMNLDLVFGAAVNPDPLLRPFTELDSKSKLGVKLVGTLLFQENGLAITFTWQNEP